MNDGSQSQPGSTSPQDKLGTSLSLYPEVFSDHEGIVFFKALSVAAHHDREFQLTGLTRVTYLFSRFLVKFSTEVLIEFSDLEKLT